MPAAQLPAKYLCLLLASACNLCPLRRSKGGTRGGTRRGKRRQGKQKEEEVNKRGIPGLGQLGQLTSDICLLLLQAKATGEAQETRLGTKC
jgi:hypothetical protein